MASGDENQTNDHNIQADKYFNIYPIWSNSNSLFHFRNSISESSKNNSTKCETIFQNKMPQILSDNEKKGDKLNKKHGGKKRNLAMICLAFLCALTSFNAVNNLQSSMDVDKNVRLHSLAILSGSSILSCFVFTIPLIYILGYKWTIIAGQIGILIYIAANIYSKTILLYLGKYISNKSTIKHMFVFSGNNSDIQVNKYFGVFNSLFHTGNIILYLA
ncbi:unnamed protein product [Adineta steineri]|uniref:Uncharacterized protein n=1 Tax=Adineta steineri TaxID=433720 RepID=A0A815R372_9BILA|nr:unnamed protein product [Adineta steineri]